MSVTKHSEYMSLALQEAQRGRYTVSPNPMVGCVIVKHNQVIGCGYHHQAGGPHAEIAALRQAGSDAQDATAYVTLEPCCHYGKTPPCTLALIQAGISKIHIACEDPNPLVAGKGIEQLRSAGIDIEIGLHETAAKQLNEIFFHFIKQRRPFVIAKWAMSLDGKTITHVEDTRDISCQASREHSHLLRQQVDAILIGANTARHDNPLLTVRYGDTNTKHPIRILLTGSGNLPLDLKIFDPALPAKTMVATTNQADGAWLRAAREKEIEILMLPANKNGQVNLPDLLDELGNRQITSLLVEGGMEVHHAFFNDNLVNKIHVYLAPVIIGALTRKRQINNVAITTIEQDFHLTANSEDNLHV